MDEETRQTMILWSRTEHYKRRIGDAKNKIAAALATYKRPYVAFSGGKDSTVLLHMVLSQRPDTLVMHWDYGRYYMPREMLTEFLDNARKIYHIVAPERAQHMPLNLRIESSPMYEYLKRSAENVLGREMLGKLVPTLRAEGYDLAFVGFRAEEACRRASRSADVYERVNGFMNCYPIGDLLVRDVWGYILSNGLPYSSHYDRYSIILKLENIRLVTFFDPEFNKFGSSNADGILMPWFKHPLG